MLRHRGVRAAGLCAGLVLMLGWAALPAARAAGVDIVIAEEGPAYGQAADAAREEIGGRAPVRVMNASQWSAAAATDQARGRPDVVLALGTRALQAVLSAPPQGNAPVVATLLPRAAFDRVTRAAPRLPEGRLGAVFLDQPPARQLNLVRLLVPGRPRIGVLVGGEGEELVQPLRAAAREARLTVREEVVAAPTELHAALTRLLAESDALVAIPDAGIFNAGTLHNILVTTYRARQPVFGFSAAYVRAGALAAVHSTPQQVGRQAGEQIVRALGGQPLPPPQWPRQFAVSVNQTVGRALDIALEDEATLTQKLARMERE
jgi:ABC-type uncharacterized transport system substrate-binding protein